MIMTPTNQVTLGSIRQREVVCWTFAAILHVLAFYWNPIVLRSGWQPPHDFVVIDVVEQPVPGGVAPAPEPKKTGLMDTLKDILMRPKMEEIAHIAPEPLTTRVAAPIQPTLKEKSMSKIASMFQPKSTAEDIAMASMPNQIQTTMKAPTLPTSGPTLTTKAFGGIKAKDLPFQVGADEAISGGGSAIPIAVGNTSLKTTIDYGKAQLQESNRKAILQGKSGYMSSGNAEMNSLGAGAASTIQLSGTGGTGNAPTGAPSGSVLKSREGSGGALGGRGTGWGSGTGRGSGLGMGSGLGSGIPSAAVQLEQELESANASGKSSKKAGSSGPEIVGPLKNRPVIKKVIPQYPAWAEEQGIIGSVRLYFTVTSEGAVRSNIKVTKTTGYPQLDELAIDALKQWRFAMIGGGGDEGQWGIITFNFALSS